MNAPVFPSNYDDAIRIAAKLYLYPWPWQQLKAQLYQESLLDPNAQSVAGAQGISEFMPATFHEAIAEMDLPADASPFDPDYEIPAAAWYMRKLRRMWTAPRRDLELWRITLASYNAGFGNLLEAQRRSGGVNGFTGIMAYLPAVTGHDNALQTQTYVDRIEKFYAQMSGAA